MAVTLTEKFWKNIDNKVVLEALVTPSNSYLTASSESFTAAQLGFNGRPERIVINPSHKLKDPAVAWTAAHLQGGLTVTLASTGLRFLYWEGDGVELVDAQDPSARPFVCWFYGT